MTAVVTAISFVDAPYPNEQRLQHLPTMLGLAGLAYYLQRFPLSWQSYFSIMLFLWIHIFGARWIYSYVPYDTWTEHLTGESLSSRFQWERNHYDRLVHFASGVLFLFPASEGLQRHTGMKSRGAAVMAIAVVLAIGAMYEVLEWQLAERLSPANAEAYNGQQGDVWDPQKDLALAWLGAVLTCPLAFHWSIATTAPAKP